MKRFRDTFGDEWKIELNLGKLMQIKDELGINLIDHPEAVPTELGQVVSLLWVAIEPGEMTDQEFYKRFDGETLHAAVSAFMEELAAFFLPISTTKATLIRELWKKAQEMDQKLAAETQIICSKLSIESPAQSR